MPPTYPELLADLYRRQVPQVRLGLTRMQSLMDALGLPLAGAGARTVLVAGTNGKGSTARLLAGALQATGARVGLYTSPHLLRFNERIALDGEPWAPEQLCALYPAVQAAAARCAEPPSFFEMTTALALLAFARAPVDWTVLEVGLGGRLDATNLVPRALAVITPIALDHRQLLGDSLTAIAGEKAGIMAAARPVVVAPQAPEAAQALRQAAQRRGALWVDAEAVTPLPDPGWPAYQAANLATARTAARLLGVSELAWQRGLAAFRWPGRYHWLQAAPPYVLDGAHNPAAIAALLDALDQDPRARGRPWLALVGALADKAVPEMLAPLRARLQGVHLCGLQVRRGLQAADWRLRCPGWPVHEDLTAGIRALRQQAPEAGILVTGSLFLVAEALAAHGGGARDPPLAS